MKRISIFKRLLILILVFILSINSFAAIVADNDGATFITKAEFDSLKNNFQAQIDNYNTSIDSKIEGAIASYLAGLKSSSTQDLVLCFNDLYDLPLKNYKATSEVKKELEDCYISVNVAGTWNFGVSSMLIQPTTIVATGDGVGHSGFTINSDYTSESAEYPIGKIYKELNLLYYARFTNPLSIYTTVGWSGSSDKWTHYFHGAHTITFYSQSGWSTMDDGWMSAGGGSATETNMSGAGWLFASQSITGPNANTQYISMDAYDGSWAGRQDSTIPNSFFSVIGTESEKFQFLISDNDVKVPLLDSNFNASRFHLGMKTSKWPKTVGDNWQNVTMTAQYIMNPEHSDYAGVAWDDMRAFYPTFVEWASGTFNKLDTLQKCANLYKNVNVNGETIKLKPLSGALLCKMVKDAIEINFEFDFKSIASGKKYHLLFKKGAGFTQSDIDAKTSEIYYINGSSTAATDTDYFDPGTVKIRLKNFDRNEKLYMTWITDDPNDGGTLNKINSATMVVDN